MPVSVTVNQNIAQMEYAVRGPLPQRAAELAKQGRATILCNIGNPQALGQPPISFYREVLSLLEAPHQLARERAFAQRPARVAAQVEDPAPLSDFVLDLAQDLLHKMHTGVGAYTDSKGWSFIREAVAAYIDRRDGVTAGRGVAADPEAVFLTNGASEAAKYLIDMLVSRPKDGIMIPIPQYPLYSAAIRRAGGVQIDYYPDEDAGWTLSRPALEDAIDKARSQGVTPKAIVVINPGNPTGAVLPAKSVDEVIEFAADHELCLIADEVYQDNLYGAEFASFARQLGTREVPLFSLHSTSKGYCGECGHRGGYVEVRNPPQVTNSALSFLEVLSKQASVSLCSNTLGQALTYLMVTPPPAGSAPHATFVAEREAILQDLYDKATLIRGAFAQMEGVQCFGRTGAMYLFPRLERLPKDTSDFDYCMALLESTGLCTVNGSGFGQRPGTQHLRIAFLPPKELLAQVLPSWITFHNDYVRR